MVRHFMRPLRPTIISFQRNLKKVTKIDFELTDTIIPAPSKGYVYINLHEGFYLFDDNHILHVSEWRQF